MKNFLQENWFKLGVMLAILVLAGAIYSGGVPKNFPVQNPPVGSIEKLRLAKQCNEDGQKSFQEDKDSATRDKSGADIVNCYYFEPKFIYSSNLNTCLYSGGYTCDLTKVRNDDPFKGEYATRWYRRIVDVYTNETLVDVRINDSSDVQEWEQRAIGVFWSESAKFGLSEDVSTALDNI